MVEIVPLIYHVFRGVMVVINRMIEMIEGTEICLTRVYVDYTFAFDSGVYFQKSILYRGIRIIRLALFL